MKRVSLEGVEREILVIQGPTKTTAQVMSELGEAAALAVQTLEPLEGYANKVLAGICDDAHQVAVPWVEVRRSRAPLKESPRGERGKVNAKARKRKAQKKARRAGRKG